MGALNISTSDMGKVMVVIQSGLVWMVEGQRWLCLGFLWVER